MAVNNGFKRCTTISNDHNGTVKQLNSFALFQIIVFKLGHALLNNIKRLFFLDKVENRSKKFICSLPLETFYDQNSIYVCQKINISGLFGNQNIHYDPLFMKLDLNTEHFDFCWFVTLLDSILKYRYTIKEKYNDVLTILK